jgi:fatty-acyl-CoA synthase
MNTTATRTMHATMMDVPLSTQLILAHGAGLHGASRVANWVDGRFQPTHFAEVARRVEALASALAALEVGPNARVATFCWNTQAHLECYLAVPSMGAVLHTLNVRLFPEQILGIMNHAEDEVVVIDASLLPTLREVLPRVPTLRHVIVIGDAATDAVTTGARVHDYETLVATHGRAFDWPLLGERDAAVVCYTTGTTGAPKGVVYSHRTIYLHTLGTLGVDTFAISQADRILLLPSMFHANAWGLPYSAWMAGADLLMPGPDLKPASIRRMIEQERPTYTAVVPTLINDLLQADRETPLDMSSFRVIVSGGSVVSPALIRAVRERWGVPVLQGWGMTETSPMCCLSIPPRGTPVADEPAWRTKSGRPVPGMFVRLADDDGRPVANDGHTVGELQLRGPWVTGAYYRNASPESFTPDGWLRTGDVGTIDPRGYVQITDRSKDVIKSGGEWVSSVDLENQISFHPAVFEAAVIGVPDPRWEERPLAVVVRRPGERVSAPELRAFLEGRVARFWLPERWAFIEAMPKTSVGKVDKKELRRQFGEGKLSIEAAT